MKKVLILADYYLPGFRAGGPIRTLASLVEELGDEFDFTILTRDRDVNDEKSFAHLDAQHRAVMGKAKVQYLESTHFLALYKAIKKESCDVLYLNSIFSKSFSVQVLLLRFLKLIKPSFTILAPRGELSKNALKIKKMRKSNYLRLAKILGLYQGVVWQAASEQERSDIFAAIKNPYRICIANDMPDMSLNRGLPSVKTKEDGILRLVFLSRITPIKNLQFALSTLSKTRNNIEFDIYGPICDEACWQECLSVMRNMPVNVTARYCGEVEPDNVVFIISRYDAFFLPTCGESFGHVIFEALLAGCPVIVSDQTQWRDLTVKQIGWDLPLESEDQFISAIDYLFAISKGEHAAMKERARSFALQYLQDNRVVLDNRTLLSCSYDEQHLTLGIDASNLRQGGGITHLLALLDAERPAGFSEVIVWCNESLKAQLPSKKWLMPVVNRKFDWSLFYRMFWQRLVLPRLARRRCDILFIPGGTYQGGFRPFVPMFQNMLPFTFSEMKKYFPSRCFIRLCLLRYFQAKTFKKASGLICLSQFARNFVCDTLKLAPKKVENIAHGIHGAFSKSEKEILPISHYSYDKPFKLLYVSTVNFYKHQPALVMAVSILRKKGYPVRLDLVGPAYRPALIKLRKTIRSVDPKFEYITYHPEVLHKELPSFYHEADMFVYPSSCENLPIILLEAMSASLPIACSNVGVMPEVLQNAGVYFDPENVDDTASVLEKLILDEDKRARISLLAHKQSQDYCWNTCSQKTFSFLHKIAAGYAVEHS